MIRSIIFNLIFWPIFGLELVLMYPIIYFSTQRRTFRLVYRTGAKILVFCLKHITGIGYEIKNLDLLKNALRNSPVIIGCNHQSTWETFIFSLLFDDISIVVKKELLSVPVAGLYFRRLKCIPVDRSSPVSSIKCLLKFGKESFKNGKSILIFPNGTRSAYNEQTEYKSGIYALYKSLGIPVIPALVNSGKYWPRRSFKKVKGTIVLDFKNSILPGLNKADFFDIFEKSID